MRCETIVAVHGLLCDASVWEHQRAALSADHHVVLPSVRGFDSLAAMAESILDQVDGSMHLIGHSMGGRVALEMLRDAPGRVASLTLLDTGVHPVGADEPARRQPLLDIAATEGIEAVAREWIPPMLHPDRHDDEALMTAMRRMVNAYSVDEFRGQIAALLGRRDARDLLAEITCPTLVACGRQDSWSTLAQHREIVAAIDGAELGVIEDSGHMATVEQPAAVTELLTGFLSNATSGNHR